MTKLTDTQLLVLASASRDETGLATRPDKLNTTAAAKVAASLIDRRYMRECLAKPGWPVWRKDGNGKAYSLKILKAGGVAFTALGNRAPSANEVSRPIAVAMANPAGVALDAPRASSKIAGILVLLEKTEGASSSEMIAATGWLPHTLRAALTGLRKRGYLIERTRTDGGATIYQLGQAADVAAAA